MRERRGVDPVPFRERVQRIILYLFDGPNWITWITHGTGAFVIAWLVNPPAAITAYVMRAGAHVAYAFGQGAPLKLSDRIPDVVSPVVTALLAGWLRSP